MKFLFCNAITSQESLIHDFCNVNYDIERIECKTTRLDNEARANMNIKEMKVIFADFNTLKSFQLSINFLCALSSSLSSALISARWKQHRTRKICGMNEKKLRIKILFYLINFCLVFRAKHFVLLLSVCGVRRRTTMNESSAREEEKKSWKIRNSWELSEHRIHKNLQIW